MFKPSGHRRGSGLLLEILMIVIGINVALWFEGWFQDLEDVETEAQYLADLRVDLLADVEHLDMAIEAGARKVEQVTSIVENWDVVAGGSAAEQAQVMHIPSSYMFFTPSGFTFRSMQESGDFRLLRDPAIKKGLLALDRRYQQIDNMQINFLQALDDGYIPLMMRRFDLATFTITDPDLFDDQLFRNFFVYTKNDTGTMVALYRLAHAEAEELLALLPEP